MENVVLTVHLILAVALILTVLLQRSEGGGLGIGGGGGGATGGRAAATALSKVTWAMAIGFLVTSLTLTYLATQRSAGDSVLERLGTGQDAPADAPALPPGLQGGDLLPTLPSEGPAAPPPAD